MIDSVEPLQDIVFIHQNMPGQFRYLAAALGQMSAYRVHFITARHGVTIAGVRSVVYTAPNKAEQSTETYARSIEGSARYGRAAAAAALELKKAGINPALVVVHPGWGEGLFICDVWPDAKILTYGEYYYQPSGGDIGFDPLFPVTPNGLFTARMMNANLLLAHEAADAVLAPTHWQKSRHPVHIQAKTAVIFDGIDTARVAPDVSAVFTLPNGVLLDVSQEIITYVARNLEPHRGYHQFIRALPMLLRARPHAQVVIVGGEDVSYSPQPPKPFPSWRAKLAAEEDLGANGRRVHHVGRLAYADYLSLLQISSVHVYYSYPFVVSWSCLESMAAGCMMVASDTAPVREVISQEEQGLLFPFFDGGAMVAAVCRALDNRDLAQNLRKAARERVFERYDLQNCLRQQLALIGHLLGTAKVRNAARG